MVARRGRVKLHWKILIGMGLGVLVGLAVNESVSVPGLSFIDEPARVVLGPFLGPVGQVFIKLLKMLIVPLIVASMVMGVARVGDIRKLGSLGGRTFAFYVLTTFASVLVGLILVNIVRPGVGGSSLGGVVPDVVDTPVSVGSILINMIPDNPIKAAAEGDILPLIIFSLLLGAVLTTLGKRAEALVGFFDSLNEAMMKLTDWVIRLTPVGVFALIATVVAETGPGIFANVGRYMLTVLLGLAVHALVTLPLLLKFAGGVSPRVYAARISPALTTAFSTASSSATLPLTMECVEVESGVSKRVSSFVLPLGATINMDGTALYESVAAVFIAQLYGIDLSLGQQVVIFFTATLAAIGAAGIPSAGLVTMAIVLKAVGLPLDGIGIIIAVDRILDMFRTSINVWGDATGCVVISRMMGEEVPETLR
jgi:Na+/H+-dicarboxylate symporter